MLSTMASWSEVMVVRAGRAGHYAGCPSTAHHWRYGMLGGAAGRAITQATVK